MGALQMRTREGVEFLIGTDFSDAERVDRPSVGAIVTFTYRGGTEAGVPRFAISLRLLDVL
jgi:DNA ligase-1